MKDPQIISIAGENPDLYLMVWGGYVIEDSGASEQDPITSTPIDIQIDLFDVTDGSTATVNNAILVYDTGSKWWRVALTSGTPTLVSQLVDRHKYVARISEEAAASPSRDMREFALEEFAVDNGSFEETLMRLPFNIMEHPSHAGELYMIWYDTDAHIGNVTYAEFMAPAYQGGTAQVPATDPSLVTHRGAIVPYA